MRKNIFILLILTVILIFGCTDEEYEITVINKSGSPIDFDFITGYRHEEHRIYPEEEWHYSLIISLSHSMGSFKPLLPIVVDYRYSDNVYTFYNAYYLLFNANGGQLIKNEKEPPMVLSIVKNDKIQMPACVWERWNQAEGRFYIFNGWIEPATGDIYPVGSFYTVSEDVSNNITLLANWE